MRKYLIALLAATIIIGCSDSKPGSADASTSEAAQPVRDANNAGGSHKGLSPEYLAGDWCYTHIEFPDEQSEENINYHFEVDGTYSAQQNSSRPLEPGWKYTFLPDGKFKLTLPRFTTTVVSVEPDAFVLHAFADLHFRRGACS